MRNFFLDANENFAFFNIFKMKWPKSEEKLYFGGRWVWVPMNLSPKQYFVAPPLAPIVTILSVLISRCKQRKQRAAHWRQCVGNVPRWESASRPGPVQVIGFCLSLCCGRERRTCFPRTEPPRGSDVARISSRRGPKFMGAPRYPRQKLKTHRIWSTIFWKDPNLTNKK